MVSAPDALVVGDGGVLGMRYLTIFVRVIHTRPADAVLVVVLKVHFPQRVSLPHTDNSAPSSRLCLPWPQPISFPGIPHPAGQ